MTKITKIQIIPIKPCKWMVAFSSFVIDGKIYCSSVAIHKKRQENWYRLTYPMKNGRDIYHPVQKEVSELIEKAVISAYKNVMNIYDWYDSPIHR